MVEVSRFIIWDRKYSTNRKAQPVARARTERDEEDLVRLYLTDIGQYPLLTKDDEVRLAQEIEAGISAREDLAKETKRKITPEKKTDAQTSEP